MTTGEGWLIWGAVGPMVGIVVGHLLTRSWQQRQRYLDNRAQEYRELLRVLTTAHMQMVRTFKGFVGEEQTSQIEELVMESLRVFHDRILSLMNWTTLTFIINGLKRTHC